MLRYKPVLNPNRSILNNRTTIITLRWDNDPKDNNKVLCFNYKEIGHYSTKCSEGNNKANTQGSMKKDLNIITCFKYKQKEHYARRCTKEDTPRLQ
jgi:hypothetical protein